MVIELNKDNFEQEVYNSDIPVIVDFWDIYCSPCKELMPTIEEIASEYSGKIKVCKINVDENRAFAIKLRVMSIPTVIAFDKGQKIAEKVNPKNKQDILSLLSGKI